MPDLKLTFCDPVAAVAEAIAEAFPGVEGVDAVPSRFEPLADSAAYDALVSPANSYGLMDGGVDAAITAYFGEQLQRRVQESIISDWGGEQPVGSCMTITIPERVICLCGHTRIRHAHSHAIPDPVTGPCGSCGCDRFDGTPPVRYLLHAPTMRVPMPIAGTENVYQAFLAVLRTIRDFNATPVKQMRSAPADPRFPHGAARAEEHLVERPAEERIRAVLCPGMGTLTGEVTPRSAAAQMRAAWDAAASRPGLSWEFARERHRVIEAATLLY